MATVDISYKKYNFTDNLPLPAFQLLAKSLNDLNFYDQNRSGYIAIATTLTVETTVPYALIWCDNYANSLPTCNAGEPDGITSQSRYLMMVFRRSSNNSISASTGNAFYRYLKLNASSQVTCNTHLFYTTSSTRRFYDNERNNHQYTNYAAPMFYYQLYADRDGDFKIEIDCPVPIFSDFEALFNWLEFGELDATKVYNAEQSVHNVNTNTKWYITNQLKKNGIVEAFKNFNFALQPNTKIYLVANNHDSEGGYPNMTLHISQLPFKYIDIVEHMTTWADAYSLTSNFIQYYYGNWVDFATGNEYTTMLNTNIPIFRTSAEGEQYERDEIGTDSSINGGKVYNSSTIGSGLGSTDIETSTFDSSASGSNLYLLNKTDMQAVKGYLFNPDQTIFDSLKNGLALWGNSPISALISLYYVPFNVSLFYDTTQAGIKFGSHLAESLGAKTIGTVGGKRITLFTTSFEGKYGDYRDYLYTRYELYLPFVGNFIPLDVNKYLNKIVTCEMLFDAYTHEVRYYLYANGIITDRVDTTVGTELPLLSTDNVAKAKADINSYNNLLTGAIGGMSAVAMGNPLGAVGNITSMVGSAQTMQTAPAEAVTGGYSSALNTFDIRYPYLRITEDLTLKPTNLNAKYNYPSYYIGSLGNLQGYCEIADCRIIGSATDNEKTQITNLLKNGVIF